jgi:hypothetical protein
MMIAGITNNTKPAFLDARAAVVEFLGRVFISRSVLRATEWLENSAGSGLSRVLQYSFASVTKAGAFVWEKNGGDFALIKIRQAG